MLRAIVGSLGNDPFQFHCSPAVCQPVWNEFRRKTFFFFFLVFLPLPIRCICRLDSERLHQLRIGWAPSSPWTDRHGWHFKMAERHARGGVVEPFRKGKALMAQMLNSRRGSLVLYSTAFNEISRTCEFLMDDPIITWNSLLVAMRTPVQRQVVTQCTPKKFFSICRVHLSGLEHPTQHDCLVGKCKAIRPSRHNCGSSLFFFLWWF